MHASAFVTPAAVILAVVILVDSLHGMELKKASSRNLVVLGSIRFGVPHLRVVFTGGIDLGATRKLEQEVREESSHSLSKSMYMQCLQSYVCMMATSKTRY